MQELILDETAFSSADQVHSYLAETLDFPAYYGANLDALNDCLGEICEPLTITVLLAGHYDAPENYTQWFPRLVRCLLRAAKDSEDFDVMVHADSFFALQRLAECPGIAELLAQDVFITQAVIACLGQEM